jgi:isopenicillin N synthase-like dioxygenase
VPRLLQALTLATGAKFTPEEAVVKYRLVNYYPRPYSHASNPSPRCDEHYDFTSATLIWQDGVGGLEVMVDGVWTPVPPHATVLLYGIFTQWRSNDRLKASLHRVVGPEATTTSAHGGGKRQCAKVELQTARQAMIMFISVGGDAQLVPALQEEGEEAIWASETMQDVYPLASTDLWKLREGIASPEEAVAVKALRRQLGDAHKFLVFARYHIPSRVRKSMG